MLALTVILVQCSTGKASKLGVTDGKLAPCPESPNCVSSQSEGKSNYVEPLTYKTTLNEAMDTLISLIDSMNRSQIVKSEDNYIHATLKSALFRFVDDIEFYFDDEKKIIEVRSASRTGYSDLGVNRKRVEEIRQRFMTR